MISSIDSLDWFGVSIKGPLHKQTGLPNQDSWYGHRNQSFVWISVCDGLGSREKSNIGSQEACRAIKHALRIWSQVERAPVRQLLRLIKDIWELRLSNEKMKDCATTCLFACVTKNGRLVVAGLGDGLAAVRFSDGRIIKVIERDTSFGNQTLALGEPHRIEDWKYFESDQIEEGTTILLATDGIADDLQVEKEAQFIEWLVQEYSRLSPRQRSQVIKKMLQNWPTPLHQDDKTMAMIYHRLPQNGSKEE